MHKANTMSQLEVVAKAQKAEGKGNVPKGVVPKGPKPGGGDGETLFLYLLPFK